MIHSTHLVLSVLPELYFDVYYLLISADLYQGTHQGADGNFGGLTANTSIVQPPLHLTIPLFSKWFDLDNIHEIEKEEFPEFFQQ